MNNDTLLEAYEPFDFYETEIENGCTALIYEPIENEAYALITDVDGTMPMDLEQEIIFAAYTADGAFAWSVGFETSHQFLELLNTYSKSDDLIDLVKNYRANGDYY
ncbi:MAG: hypothetical protein H7X79_09410 [Sporomusaceae bacterium]|nr:hypothetical protein [Sporomusaceae bacterium]